jgi:two-component system, chemotaxis family, response regulator Rcp1
MNILLVEDNEDNIDLTEWAFKKGNLLSTLSVAHDGVEAMEYLNRQGKFSDAIRPDLVLLDINMPRMDGRKFLEIVKQDEKFKSIPIIMLTSSSAPKDVQECYERHANCYILKPFDAGKFMDMAKQVESFWANLAQLPGQTVAL